MNVKRTQVGWKKLGTCMAMVFVSLFLVMMNTRTVSAETFNCEVYYDVAKNAVLTGNAEGGCNLQLDADLCEIAKQISVNGASGLSYYGFKDRTWITTMIEKTGNLKSCMEYTGGFKYCYGDLVELQESIASSMKYIAEYHPDYNLVGISAIHNGREMEGVEFYYYTIVIGKGTCKPDTNTGTRKEVLKTSSTVTLSNSSTNDSGSNTAVKVTSVKINADSKKLLTGKKMTLTATVLPTNAADKSVKWSVSNKKYATINQKGVLKAKAAGAGKTITVTAEAKDGSGKKATYKIKIKGAVSKITLKAAKKSVKAGKKVTINAAVKVGKGGSKALKWTSSNNSWATVNAKGVVTTKKAGKGQKVKITATAKDGSGKKASVTIKLK